MSKKRILALALALTLTVGSLAGCGSNSSGGKTNDGNNDSISLPEKLEGDVIKILAYDGWEEEHGDIRKTLKDLYGASVEYTVCNWLEMKNKLSVDLAANITYDFMPVGMDAVYNNLCIPVTKYYDLNDKIFKDYKNVSDSITYEGELYGVPSVPNMEVIVYNKTLIENLGYETPLDLYKADNWNWDTFKKLATSLCKEKTSGGEAINAFSSWDTQVFLSANDTGYIKWDNQKYSLNLDDSKMREALNFFKDLCTTGAFTGWQGWSQADFQLGTTAMILDRFGNKTHFTSDLTFDWDFVPIPQGYSASGKTAPGTIAIYGIPKGSKNPTGGAAYGYLFCKQDYTRRKEYLGGYLSKEQVERFESLYPKITRNHESIGITNTDELIWSISNGADVTSTLESYKTKWQAELDTYTAGLPKK